MPKLNPDRVPLTCSPTHAQALTAHLKTVEDFCGEVRRLVDARDGIFCEYSGHIADAESERIGALLKKVCRGLTELRDGLGLSKQQMNRFNAINAYLSELWVSLVETKSRHLKAYGPVPENLAAYLDPRLDAMDAQISELREIISTLKSRQTSSEGDRTFGEPGRKADSSSRARH